MDQIYLDYNATAPILPPVLEAMLPFFQDRFGNPSSIHWAGRAVSGVVEQAREQVARLIGANPEEIVFIACGSEGNNLALKGSFDILQPQGAHIITTAVEHPAVLETCQYLQKIGARVTYLPVDEDGTLDLQQLEDAICDDTILISVMWGNNETGNLFPIAEIGEIARRHRIRFHTDAVQAVGKVEVDVVAAGVDLLVLSGHKFGAPKGVGAIYVRRGTRLTPLLHGGHQERHRRAGTHNVAGIVGLGVACEQVQNLLPIDSGRIAGLRDRLERELLAGIPDTEINGHPDALKRLPNTLNLSFAGVEGESLLLNLDLQGIAASSGSACTSGSLEASHVLKAMAIPDQRAHSSIRFSLGPGTTEAEIERLLELLPSTVKRLRDMSPIYKG